VILIDFCSDQRIIFIQLANNHIKIKIKLKWKTILVI